MPKIVDHGERRAAVLEATWRVISTTGLESATVREIAKAAGVSNGVLAHYFASKDAILVEAHRLAYDRVFARVAERTEGLDSVETFRHMLYEALPLDEERRVEALVDVSYMGRAITDEALREVRQGSVRAARGWWLDALTRAAAEGYLRPGVDLHLLVDELLVFIDGVSIQAVLHPEAMTPDRQRLLADAVIARVTA